MNPIFGNHGRWRAAPAAVVMAAALLASTGWAQTSPASGSGEPNSPAETDQAREIGRLMLNRPTPPIIEPMVGGRRPIDRRPIPAEGVTWIDRAVRVETDPNNPWTMLHFAPEPGQADQTPLRALPCRLLEFVEQASKTRPGVRFRMSGRTTSHGRRGFFLIQDVKVILPSDLPEALAGTGTDATESDGEPPSEKEGAAGDGTSAPRGESDTDGSHAQRVLRGMFERDRRAPVILPSETHTPEPTPDGRYSLTRLVELSQRRPLVVARSAKIEDDPSSRGWSVARFIADNNLGEPPMRLLPNRLLERAERLSSSLRLRVSGIVTNYRGRKYLLLHKVDYEPPMGQF